MKTAILHYTVPPVVGGVEAVILAHTKLLLKADYPVTVIAGAGERSAMPDGVDFIQIAVNRAIRKWLRSVSNLKLVC
jgi:hypothetical protein